MRQERKELHAAGLLYVALTEYKKPGPTTPSTLSVGTPGNKRSGPYQFRRILERRRVESGEESMDETLSEAGEDMEVGNTPEPKPSEEEFTTQELLKDLIGENWSDTATPPLTSSPRKNLELPLTSGTSNMGMILLSAEGREKNTFEGNRDMFLGTLDEDAWREFLSDFNREVNGEITLDEFKEELWDTVVKFGEPVVMGTGLEEKARGELLSKMVQLRKASRKTKEDECKDSSTLKQKNVDKIIESVKGDKVEASIILKVLISLRLEQGEARVGRVGWRQRCRISNDNGNDNASSICRREPGPRSEWSPAQELVEALGPERVSHEDLGRHQCVDWLKAHETHFSRAKIMETADLTGIPTKLVMGPINYRPLKLLGSPGLIVEPSKHRTSIARIRLATPAQLRVVDKLLDPREMELPDAAYEGTRLADDPRYGKPCGNTQLAKTLPVYDRADPAAARVVIVAGSDFEGTSPKLFWPETLIYSLPGAELNQMLTLVVAIKSEMPCEPELLLFAGMNDHLHATGFLEQLKSDEPAPKRIWEAIQTLFEAMNEVQENGTSRFGSKTRVVFTTSPGYASMPPAVQFVYAVLILIAEGNGWRILMAAPNRELESTNWSRR